MRRHLGWPGTFPTKREMTMATIVIPLMSGIMLQTGTVIALQADNHCYLSRIDTNVGAESRDEVWAAKSEIDEYCRFQVLAFPNSTIALLADNQRFLSRINRGNTNPIEAAKTEPDLYSRFAVTVFDNGTIALAADNGLYLSRWDIGDDISRIWAAKPEIDMYCQFVVEVLDEA